MGEKRDKALQVIAAAQSLKSNLETEDLTGTIIYLTSNASKFVTGQTIMVDGGTVML
jgi:enoyl-[acyl-carrier-protein] reductase (NADH)